MNHWQDFGQLVPVEPNIPALFEQHAGTISAYVLRRNVDRSTAEDIVQMTFIEAYKCRRNYDDRRGTHRAWLFGIATNLMHHHFRDEQRQREAYVAAAALELARADDCDAASTSLDARTVDASIVAALATLSRGDYEVLTLHCWSELSHQEIATVLGIPSGTVKSRLNRARRKLSPQLRGHLPPRPHRQLRPRPDPSIVEANDG